MEGFTSSSHIVRAGARGRFDSAGYSGQYEVQYTVISADVLIGPKEVLRIAQLPATGPHPVPRKWSQYNYEGILGTGAEVDTSSYLTDYDVVNLEPSQNKWIITCYYRRLNDDELPQSYLAGHKGITNPPFLGDPITNPMQRYPIFQLRRFTLANLQQHGWPCEQIQDQPKFAPVNGNGSTLLSPWIDYQPIDSENKGYHITASNLLVPANFVRKNTEYSVVVCRMNFPTVGSFQSWDRVLRDTIYNGGNAWQNNGGPEEDRTSFFGVWEGMARYQGGGVVGGRKEDSGIPYYECELRFELLWPEWPDEGNFTDTQFKDEEKLPFVASVSNASNIEMQSSGEPRLITIRDVNQNEVVTSQPLFLGLDGLRDGDQRNPSNPFIHYWYARPADYGIVGNGFWTIGEFSNS